MSYVYQALVMLPNENQPSLELIKERLQTAFDLKNSIARIRVKLDRLIIAIDDWQMNIYPNNHPNAIVETQKAASYLDQDDPETPDLANYGFQIEVNCDPDLDPHMQHFNHYVSVLEALANFPGAIIFNPSTQGFIE